MIKIRNILSLLFILLLVIIIAEVGFYFYIKTSGNQIASQPEIDKNSVSNVPATDQTKSTLAPTLANVFKLVDADVIDSLSRTVTTAEASNSGKVYVVYEFHSKVENVESGKEESAPFTLTLAGSGIHPLSSKKLEKVKVFLSQGSLQSEPASLEDIKIGDMVLIREYFDVSKPMRTLEGLTEILITIER